MITNSNLPEISIPPDDEVLRLFLLGRGHAAMRAYVRETRDGSWPLPRVRFLVEALYSRFGQIARNGMLLADLSRFRRVLQELLAECIGAPADFKQRIGSISDIVTDLINQEGGPDSFAILSDTSVRKIVELLLEKREVAEEALREASGDSEIFNQAITSLIVADLVNFSYEDDSYTYRLTDKGERRWRQASGDDPLIDLKFAPEDIDIRHPVQPIFDLLILPFAQAVMSRPELQRFNDAAFLQEYGVEIKLRLLQRPLVEWYNLDEAYLVPPTDADADGGSEGVIGAITLPRVHSSPVALESSIDIAVGDAFTGFHLLVHKDMLAKVSLNTDTEIFRRLKQPFPASADEIRSIVGWDDLGRWLTRRKLRARILGDRATHDIMELLLPLSEFASEVVELESVESNSGRLEALENADEGYLTIAIATGPLLAIARQANLTILTSSWNMLESARKGQLDFTTLSATVFRQYVFLGLPWEAFQDNPRTEERVYRVMAFVEATYRLIRSNPDLFAEYCSRQWDEFGEKFKDYKEFKYKLNVQDIRFALDGSYRWMGHDLEHLTTKADWPEDLQGCDFWTEAEAGQVRWPDIWRRRRQLEQRVDLLCKEALELAGERDIETRRYLSDRIPQLKLLGYYRRAEAGLERFLSKTKSREAPHSG